jgi:integrase/recombinase XerC
VTPHVLRHSFAKALIDSGVSLEKVAFLLGHSNLNTTRIYMTPGERDLEEAVRTLEDFQKKPISTFIIFLEKR